MITRESHAGRDGGVRGMREAAAARLLAVAAVGLLAACQSARPQASDTLAGEMPGPADTTSNDGAERVAAGPAASDGAERVAVGPTASDSAEGVAVGPTQGDTDVSGIIGKPAPGWSLERWFNSPPLTVESLRGSVVLVRWFMSPECPLCSATAPSLRAFHEQYADRGLRVIGMYHHKGKQPLDPGDVQGYVKHYGFEFPVAIDADWQTLRRWWLDGHERGYTSVSFLVDRAGTVRHVHLGGKYEPGSADHAQMQQWIESLLAER